MSSSKILAELSVLQVYRNEIHKSNKEGTLINCESKEIFFFFLFFCPRQPIIQHDK